MELVDVRDSKSRGPLGRVGSTPTSGINKIKYLSHIVTGFWPVLSYFLTNI